MENDFRIKKINAKEAEILAEIKVGDIGITSDSDNDEDELEKLEKESLQLMFFRCQECLDRFQNWGIKSAEINAALN